MAKRLNVKLVDNAKSLHKSYSVILMAVLTVLSFAEMILPSTSILRDHMDPELYSRIVFALTVMALVGRHIKQNLGIKEEPTAKTTTESPIEDDINVP